MARRTLRQMFDRFEERHQVNQAEQSPEQKFGAWLDSVVAETSHGAPSFETHNEVSDLKARACAIFARARECAAATPAKPHPPVAADEEAAARAFVQQQEENLASYAARHAKDMARAEELKLRPHVLALLPILDALDMAKKDAARPDCDAANLHQALSMVADGLRSAIPTIK